MCGCRHVHQWGSRSSALMVRVNVARDCSTVDVRLLAMAYRRGNSSWSCEIVDRLGLTAENLRSANIVRAPVASASSCAGGLRLSPIRHKLMFNLMRGRVVIKRHSPYDDDCLSTAHSRRLRPGPSGPPGRGQTLGPTLLLGVRPRMARLIQARPNFKSRSTVASEVAKICAVSAFELPAK